MVLLWCLKLYLICRGTTMHTYLHVNGLCLDLKLWMLLCLVNVISYEGIQYQRVLHKNLQGQTVWHLGRIMCEGSCLDCLYSNFRYIVTFQNDVNHFFNVARFRVHMRILWRFYSGRILMLMKKSPKFISEVLVISI